MFTAVLLIRIRKETYTLTRKESDNFAFRRIQTFEVTELNKLPRSFHFFSARAESLLSYKRPALYTNSKGVV